MCSIVVASSLMMIDVADQGAAGFVSVFAADVVLSAVVTDVVLSAVVTDVVISAAVTDVVISAVVTDVVLSVRISVVADAVSSEVEGVVVAWVFVFAVVCVVIYS